MSAEGTAGVMTTEAFLAAKPDVRFATQSGPMLVIDGALHPMFIPGSSDRNPRNGVCAPTPTTVDFVITEGTVNFHDFGRFFRDKLACKDALFLDGGSASALYAPELGRNDGPGHGGFGPIIARGDEGAGHLKERLRRARRGRPERTNPLTSLARGAHEAQQTRTFAMQKFTTLTAVAAPLNMMNVDTDMIIPKDYLKTIERTGLGKGLFSEMRYNEDGSDNPDFVLNKPAYRNAKILVAGDNFGCGSSREHAPWALLDFGIRCVISTSFADIFHNNCFKNGILPVVVSKEDLDKLMDDASRGANATITIDLDAQEIHGPDGGTVKFEVDAVQEALPAQRPRRHRPDHGKGRPHRRPREPRRRKPPLGLASRFCPRAPARRVAGQPDCAQLGANSAQFTPCSCLFGY